MFLGCAQFLSSLVEQRQIVSLVKDALPSYLINNSRCRADQYVYIVNRKFHVAGDRRVPLCANHIMRLLVFSVRPLHRPSVPIVAHIFPKNSHRILDMLTQPQMPSNMTYCIFRLAFAQSELPRFWSARPALAQPGTPAVPRFWPLVSAKQT